MRSLLILTCTSVSFSHGTNDGQKSIGLIMLTVIGLMPASYALNPQAHDQLAALSRNAEAAIPLIQRYGDDRKDQALHAADVLKDSGSNIAEQYVARVADTTPEAGSGCLAPFALVWAPWSATNVSYARWASALAKPT